MGALWIIAIALIVQTTIQVASTITTAAIAWKFRRAFKVPEIDHDGDEFERVTLDDVSEHRTTRGVLHDGLWVNCERCALDPREHGADEPIPVPCDGPACSFCGRVEQRDPLTETGVRRVLDRAGVRSRFDKRTDPP